VHPGAHARNLIRPLFAGAYRFRMTGGHHLPLRGGVILIAEQSGVLDPTIMATALTRPVRVLTQVDTPALRWPALSSALGRIDVPATGPVWEVLQGAVAALERGDAVGVFVSSPFGVSALAPQSAIAAYLHARTHKPIVPVTIFGSTGRRPTDLPRPRSMIECHLAAPKDIPGPPDSANLMALRQHAERIRQICTDAKAEAMGRTGRDR
jgi:1-acyl-sn-glycerol-3-phosphate acyltransferase